VREAFTSSFYDNYGEQQKYTQWMLNQDIKNKVIQLMMVKIPVNSDMKLTKKSTEDFSSMRESRIEGANEKPSALLQQAFAYATWSSSHKVSTAQLGWGQRDRSQCRFKHGSVRSSGGR
jgi:hypothetical protein